MSGELEQATGYIYYCHRCQGGPKEGARTSVNTRGRACKELGVKDDPTTVDFHNFNLRIFNLRVSNLNKLIVDVFFWHDVEFQCARVSAQKNTMKFRTSTIKDDPTSCSSRPPLLGAAPDISTARRALGYSAEGGAVGGGCCGCGQYYIAS